MTYSYVYKHTNKTTNEFYYGYRKRNIHYGREPDNDFLQYYTCSSTLQYQDSTLKEHIKDHRNEWISEIIYYGFTPDASYDFEQYLIFESWGNTLLLNKTCYHNKGRLVATKHTDEHKQYLSRLYKGRDNYWCRGIKRPDHSKLMTESNPMKNKNHSDDSKRRMSENSRGIRNGMFGKKKVRHICPGCSKNTTRSALTRFHQNC